MKNGEAAPVLTPRGRRWLTVAALAFLLLALTFNPWTVT